MSKRMDTIVHLGAGRCLELAEHLDAGPTHLLLVEPDPAHAKALRLKCFGQLTAEVKEVAVGANSGPSELRVFNYTEVSSLREPTGLLELFPGLRETHRVAVETMTVAELLEPLALTREQANRLVIDTPGEELEIVEGLVDAKLLHAFESVALTCGRRPLYAGSKPSHVIVERLQQHGYALSDCDESGDPDRPKWLLKRDDARIDDRRARQQLKEQGVALEQARERIRVLETERDELEHQHTIVEQELRNAETQIDLLKELLLQERNSTITTPAQIAHAEPEADNRRIGGQQDADSTGLTPPTTGSPAACR